MREICEALEWGNFEVEKELTLLREKVKAVNSLQEEIDQYDHLFNLVAQITKLTASMADAEECQKKAYEEVMVYREFEMDHKVL